MIQNKKRSKMNPFAQDDNTTDVNSPSKIEYMLVDKAKPHISQVGDGCNDLEGLKLFSINEKWFLTNEK